MLPRLTISLAFFGAVGAIPLVLTFLDDAPDVFTSESNEVDFGLVEPGDSATQPLLLLNPLSESVNVVIDALPIELTIVKPYSLESNLVRFDQHTGIETTVRLIEVAEGTSSRIKRVASCPAWLDASITDDGKCLQLTRRKSQDDSTSQVEIEVELAGGEHTVLEAIGCVDATSG